MKPRARQKRGETTRQRIREAAAIEFAAKGYEGASVRAIARACDVEQASVQYHFGDKLGLWSAVLDDVMEPHHVAIDDAVAQAADRGPGEMVAAFLAALIRGAATDPVFVSILSHARTTRGSESAAFHERFGSSVQGIAKLIAEAQAEGEVIAGDPGLLQYLMIGAALYLYMAPIDAEELTGLQAGDPALPDEHLRVVLAAFMPGRADPDAFQVAPPKALGSPGR